MLKRILGVSLLLLFSCGSLWADGGLTLGSATGGLQLTCAGSTDTYNFNGTTGLVGSGACDQSFTDDYGNTIGVSGAGYVTFVTKPAVDVTGAVTDPSSEFSGTFSGTAYIGYDVALEELVGPPPPEAVSTIPVDVTLTAESGGTGVTFASIYGYFVGGGYDVTLLPNAPTILQFVPGTEYLASQYASCSTYTIYNGDPSSEYAECSALADPAFQFDQAAFDAEMAAQGLPSFSLSEYYSFVYSPNLIPAPTPTPEPSSLSLLLGGFFVMGLMALRGRFTRRHQRLHYAV
jgi:hypothetical protein